MPPLYMVSAPGAVAGYDAALPQDGALDKNSCQSGYLSAIVHTDRTQAVCTSRRGTACCTSFQEHRSRGCRAPRSPFCRWAWLPSWPPAQRPQRKKSFTSKSRLCRLTYRTPASTSKTKGRALWAAMAQPALFLSAARQSGPCADIPTPTAERFEIRRAAAYAGRTATHFNRRFPCGLSPLLPCLPLPPSLLAPSPHPSPSRFLSPLNPRRPANTAPDPTTERARRVDRQPPVPALRAPQQKVRLC